MTERSQLDVHCNWCGEPMILHGSLRSRWHGFLCLLADTPSTYECNAAVYRKPEPAETKRYKPLSVYPWTILSDLNAPEPGQMTPVLRGESVSDVVRSLSKNPRWLTHPDAPKAWVRLLMDYREEHTQCRETTILTESRCDLCIAFDSIPTDTINAFLKEAR